MSSTEWAKRIIAEELERESPEPAPARIVARLQQARMLREFFYNGESIEPRTTDLPVNP